MHSFDLHTFINMMSHYTGVSGFTWWKLCEIGKTSLLHHVKKNLDFFEFVKCKNLTQFPHCVLMTKILFDICSWCIDKLVKIWKKSSIFIVGKIEIMDLRQIFGRVFFRKKNSLIFRRRQKQLRKSLNLQLIIVISIQK